MDHGCVDSKVLEQYLAGGLDRVEIAALESHCQACGACQRQLRVRTLTWLLQDKTVNAAQCLAYGDCFSLETLQRYLQGQLSTAERALVDEHRAQCASCQDELALLRDDIVYPHELQGPPRAEDEPERSSAQTTPALAAAVTVALVYRQITRVLWQAARRRAAPSVHDQRGDSRRSDPGVWEAVVRLPREVAERCYAQAEQLLTVKLYRQPDVDDPQRFSPTLEVAPPPGKAPLTFRLVFPQGESRSLTVEVPRGRQKTAASPPGEPLVPGAFVGNPLDIGIEVR